MHVCGRRAGLKENLRGLQLLRWKTTSNSVGFASELEQIVAYAQCENKRLRAKTREQPQIEWNKSTSIFASECS